jgi:hypothetical protein
LIHSLVNTNGITSERKWILPDVVSICSKLKGTSIMLYYDICHTLLKL